MHDLINEIFKDAGASERDLQKIEAAAVVVAAEVRELVLQCAATHPNKNLHLPLRVLLCRVIHADMEKAFTQYKTEGPSVQ